jgi:hypothetical protein
MSAVRRVRAEPDVRTAAGWSRDKEFPRKLQRGIDTLGRRANQFQKPGDFQARSLERNG